MVHFSASPKNEPHSTSLHERITLNHQKDTKHIMIKHFITTIFKYRIKKNIKVVGTNISNLAFVFNTFAENFLL
ncbi:MAG: hypothetical protein U5L45_18295 [Saprospiraceae bacterium]|nr:hypothetical protein [Saprospiraceae bacterium]